jgi:HEAT repeat protein
LRRLLDGSDLQSQCFALIALAQTCARGGENGAEEGALEARNVMLHKLENGKSRERTWAALALGVFEHARIARGLEPSRAVRGALENALKDCGSGDEVGALAIGLGLARDEEAVPVLIARLDRMADARTRGYLAVALGLIGDPRAVSPLQKLLAESRFRPDILQPTAIGLALLEDRTLSMTLVGTLSQATSLASQSAAASVLGWIGDRNSIPPLVELLRKKDVTASARGFAAVALGRVCDRDRLPWNSIVSTGLQYRASTDTLISSDGTGLLDLL